MANRRKIDHEEKLARRRAALHWAGTWLLRGFAALSVLVAVPAAGHAAYRWLITSPTFSIGEIMISGIERTSDRDLRSWLGISEGDNVFVTDTAAAERRLASLPWVEDARVRVRFPQGLAVEVLERRAVALVDLGHLYLVDPRGRVFKRAMPKDPLDLPVITGLPRDDWAEGGIARDRLLRALETLEALSAHPVLSGLPPQELQVDEAGGLTLFLGERGMMVLLGSGDLEKKLDRLSLVIDEAERLGKRVEMVRLDNRTRPEWIAARLSRKGSGSKSTPQG